MRDRVQKINFVVLFLLFLLFSLYMLYNKMEFHAFMIFYLLFCASVSDICFGVNDKDNRLRAYCWIVLQIGLGVVLSVSAYFKGDMFLLGAIAFCVLFFSSINLYVLKRNNRL